MSLFKGSDFGKNNYPMDKAKTCSWDKFILDKSLARKYYFIDTGLRNARLNFAFPDEGQMLENIVYNELLYRGYSVNVGSFDTVEKDKNGCSVRKTNEVDFFAVKGISKYYIQVSADISDAVTRAREIRPYMLLNDEIKKIIVINRPVKETVDENGFTIIGITDFLLRFL